jgi:hypothetical protein
LRYRKCAFITDGYGGGYAAIEYRNTVKAVPKDPAAHWKLAKASLEATDIRTGFSELQKGVKR